VARCIPPAIYVRILEICGVKQSVHEYFCKMCVPQQFEQLLNCWAQKNLVHVVCISQIPNQKNLPFLGIENFSNIIHLEYFVPKMYKNCNNMSTKGPFKTMVEEK
jgi:hypothetical protein